MAYLPPRRRRGKMHDGETHRHTHTHTYTHTDTHRHTHTAGSPSQSVDVLSSPGFSGLLLLTKVQPLSLYVPDPRR